MVIDKSQLAAILRIGHDSSMRGEGISLQDAIARSGYVEIRNKFGPLDLVPLLREKPELMMQWVMFSEDKRTGGYWISEATNEVGLTLSQQPAIKYGSVEEAVSRFVVLELDFWFRVIDKDSPPWPKKPWWKFW